MSETKFIEALKATTVESNLKAYKDIFEKTTLNNEVKDPYWKDALLLFNSLNNDQKRIFFSILRQVAIDTTAQILGILDGTSSMDGYDAEFKLTTSENGQVINGDLQDIFLASVE